jgi:hypothetical protein
MSGESHIRPQLQAEYDSKTAADNEKAALIKQMQEDHAEEMRNFKLDSKKITQKEVCQTSLSHTYPQTPQFTDRRTTDAKIKSLEKELSDMTRKFNSADADRVSVLPLIHLSLISIFEDRAFC